MPRPRKRRYERQREVLVNSAVNRRIAELVAESSGCSVEAVLADWQADVDARPPSPERLGGAALRDRVDELMSVLRRHGER